MEGPPDGNNDRPYYLTPNDVTEWLKANYKLGKDGHMAKSTIYDDYLELCELRGAKPIISPTFYGKLVKRAFPGIQSIRKGPRGQVRQCYARLKKRKRPVPVHTLHDDASANISPGLMLQAAHQDAFIDSPAQGSPYPDTQQTNRRSPPQALLPPAPYLQPYNFNLPAMASPGIDVRNAPGAHHQAYLPQFHPLHFGGVTFSTPGYPGPMGLPVPHAGMYRIVSDSERPSAEPQYRVKHEYEDPSRAGGVHEPPRSWSELRGLGSQQYPSHDSHGKGQEPSPGSADSPATHSSPSPHHQSIPSTQQSQLPSYLHPHPALMSQHQSEVSQLQSLHHSRPYLTDTYPSYVDPLRDGHPPSLGHPHYASTSYPVTSPVLRSSFPPPSMSAALSQHPGPINPHHALMSSPIPYSGSLPDLHSASLLGRGASVGGPMILPPLDSQRGGRSAASSSSSSFEKGDARS